MWACRILSRVSGDNGERGLVLCAKRILARVSSETGLGALD